MYLIIKFIKPEFQAFIILFVERLYFKEKFMGFFSWKTSDDKKSIACVHSSKECKITYLLQPNKQPIQECSYQGDGVFGGVDAYEWIVEHNLSKKALEKWKDKFSKETRSLGITLESTQPQYYTDKMGNIMVEDEESFYLVNVFLNEKSTKLFPNNNVDFGLVINIDGINSSINEHIESNRLIGHNFNKFVKQPLKFSFNENAIYSELEPAVRCEHQGFFYL